MPRESGPMTAVEAEPLMRDSLSSVIFPIEVQADYIKQVVLEMRQKGMKALEVKEQAAREYERSVWRESDALRRR